MKIYSALYNGFRPLRTFYPEAERVILQGDDEFSGAGILILWGGSDIHPSIYNRPNIASFVGNAPSYRDQAEMKLFVKAVAAGIPIVGVCRGAQLACAMLGGILVQDVSGHGYGEHRITTSTGEVVVSSTVHHQMMYPWLIEHELLAWSTIPRSTLYEGLTDEELAKWPTKEYDAGSSEAHIGVIEPEIVWFPQAKCLAIQGHPEYQDASTPFNQYIKRQLDVRCGPSVLEHGKHQVSH